MAAKVQAATELLGRQRLPQESLDAVFAAMAAADAANRIVDVLLEEHDDAARLSLLTDALTPPSVLDRVRQWKLCTDWRFVESASRMTPAALSMDKLQRLRSLRAAHSQKCSHLCGLVAILPTQMR